VKFHSRLNQLPDSSQPNSQAIGKAERTCAADVMLLFVSSALIAVARLAGLDRGRIRLILPPRESLSCRKLPELFAFFLSQNQKRRI